jgi:hypothetical protein
LIERLPHSGADARQREDPGRKILRGQAEDREKE